MRSNPNEVAIIGAGIIGVTTAFALLERGFKVTVLEVNKSAALGTSYANAGELSFGYSGPWATPGLPLKVPGMLMDPNGPLRIHADFSSLTAFFYQVKWLRWFTRNTRRAAFEQNKRRIVALSRHSKGAHARMFGGLPLDYAHQSLGTLQLFRSQKQMDAVLKNDVAALKQAGVLFDVVNPAACVRQEPGLAAIAKQIAGGLIFRDDETGDCRAFTQGLADLLAVRGVDIRYGVSVKSVDADDHGVRGVRTSMGYLSTPRLILCCGPWTRTLAKPLGLEVPIYPVRGYSLTAPISNPARAPVSTVLDETTKIACTRLGNAIRVGGTAEIAGFRRPESVSRRALLRTATEMIFPGCASLGIGASLENWAGFRPMTPDGTPIVGATVVPGLFVNAGHGTLGWTQSAGSADLCADILCGHVPALDPSDYHLERYGAGFQVKKLYVVRRPSLEALS